MEEMADVIGKIGGTVWTYRRSKWCSARHGRQMSLRKGTRNQAIEFFPQNSCGSGVGAVKSRRPTPTPSSL